MMLEIVNNSECWVEYEREDGARLTFTEVRGKSHANHHQCALVAQVSPLYLACQNGKTKFALSLLRAGASPDALARWSESRLFTPLHVAASCNRKLCRALLDAAAIVRIGRITLESSTTMNPEVSKMISGACTILINHLCIRLALFLI